ncbi:cell division protein FtsW [Dokdonia sp. Hel_I_63]|uniref:FtsW/RodA/SpoVE family cell cycle protein n=1 Tax=unclassified Dokdonia TaxID=2615033 RepID=UPI00020A78F1|nr:MULTISPECIES: FtsW/RodA/SpoVE family cell cycle protein [unclassified Dokdonia]AEE19873.1 cell cycle protein [Dokdonia sp. 4H-3-7-5]TVZ23909.1 cell division protein FtsW [Dokdonia sp. Hel_I_63]
MSTTFKNIFAGLQGDKTIWAIVALLALFSFLPVYSAASNLAYIKGDGNTVRFLIKHGMHLVLGFAMLYGVHKIPHHYFKGLSFIALPVVIILLIVTLAQGTTMGGANASRWIKIPILGVGFQTSTFAGVVLMVYVARYLAKIKDTAVTFKETIVPLWLPVAAVLALILPANFSTTAIIAAMVVALVFLGGYPLKYLGIVIATGVVALLFFVLLAKAFPGVFPNRVDTWISRVENFANNEVDADADYQIEKAKIAIASGGVIGLGPGKSVQKNFLPQSSSDFIYAIIVEEFGLAGAGFLLFLYMLLLFRITVVAHKADTVFAKLVVVGVGLPIVFQALINMAVAVELFPVTGQTLPLVSSGGTSIWMTCLAVGIVLSVSAKRAPVVPKEESELNPLDILSEAI